MTLQVFCIELALRRLTSLKVNYRSHFSVLFGLGLQLCVSLNLPVLFAASSLAHRAAFIFYRDLVDQDVQIGKELDFAT